MALTVALATADNSTSSKAGDNEDDKRPEPNDNYSSWLKIEVLHFRPSSSSEVSSILCSKPPPAHTHILTWS